MENTEKTPVVATPSTVNFITVEGRLFGEPKDFITSNGNLKVSFWIARTDVKATYTRDLSGKPVKNVTQAKVVLWNNPAAAALEMLHTGDRVLFTGEFRDSEFVDCDGQKRHDREFVAKRFDRVTAGKVAFAAAVVAAYDEVNEIDILAGIQ
jgi:single-stranded DNA-binding protein